MSEDATRALEQKDSDQIREIFNDPALDGKTKAERAFKVAMTARLKDLPVLDQKKIWESVENAVHDIDEKIYGLARSNGRITITGPEDYFRSLSYYALVVHEAEHQIQYFHSFNPLYKAATFKYLIEDGAMRAEWSFIHSIPEDARLEMIKTLESYPNIGNDFPIRSLKNAHLSIEDYLKAERKAGRFSIANAWKKQYIERAWIYSSLFPVKFYGWKKVCDLSRSITLKHADDVDHGKLKKLFGFCKYAAFPLFLR